MLLTKPEKFALLAGVVLYIFLILLTGLMPGDQASEHASFRSTVRRRKAWSIEGGRLMLGMPDSPIQDKNWLTLYLSGDSGLTGAAIEECESPLQFFILVEKNILKGPGDYKYFEQLFANKIAYDKKIENIRELALLSKKIDIAALLSWMLTVLMWVSKELINRYKVKRHKSRCSKKGGDYQLPVAAIEEFKLLLQLFVLSEKYALISPGQLEYLTKILQYRKIIAICKDKENYPDVAYVDKLWENLMQERREDEVRKKMQEMKIAERRRAAESMPSVKTEPGDDETEASVTRDLRVGPIIEDTTRSTEWTLFDEIITLLMPMLFVPMCFVLKLVDPIQASNRYEVKRLKSLSSDGGRQICSRDERDKFTSYLSGSDSPLPVATIEECKSLLQLFVLMEKYPLNGQRDPEYPLISPGHLEDFTQIMQSIGKDIAIVKEIKNYLDAGHMPDLPKYKMDNTPRGKCIIFNAENFTGEDLEQRDGTQKDVEALLNTFRNQLKFETCVVQDPTKKEYVECLQNIARMDHSKFDCFVCVILSHGCKGSVLGTDGETVSINALTGLFRGDYVPSLVNKPKLFFIQACQGAYPQEAVEFHQDATATLPNESDTLVSQATVPGYASCRSANQGSLFISLLCNIINTNYEKVDLLSMLTMVNEQMSRRALKGKWMEIGKQIGNPSHTLRKQIFFNQGLDE